MVRYFNKKLLVPLTLLILLILSVSLVGCNETEDIPLKADVKITITNKVGQPITNTEVSIINMSAADISYIYTTDANGQFTIKNLGERELTFIIHNKEKSYTTKYAVTKNELEKGVLTVKFNDYE